MVATAPVLGKRKLSSRSDVQSDTQYGQASLQETERNASESSDAEDDDAQDMRDVLRSHFEARFAPLENVDIPSEHSSFNVRKEAKDPGQHNERGSNSDWEGLSDGDSDAETTGIQKRPPVHIVEYHETQLPAYKTSRAKMKEFLKYRPAISDMGHLRETSSMRNNEHGNKDEDERSESLNLKNDLELQRLISESHLLDTSNASNLQNQRHKILDVRLQALGSKKSVLDHKNSKMPMVLRKGITSKANQKEAKRRAEAKENGIVLEQPAHKMQPRKNRVRTGGVSDPAVGKFRGGATLQLSKKDVAEIRGSRGDIITRRNIAKTKRRKNLKKKTR